MLVRWAFPLVLTIAGCSTPTGTFDGKVVDPLTGKGREGVRVLGRAPNDVLDAACQVLEATTGADGTFHFEGTCQDVTYSVKIMDPKLLAPEIPAVQGGAPATGTVEIPAWRIPGSSGVYVLRNDEMDSLRTNAPVEGVWIQKTAKKEVALYPTTMPSTVPAIVEGAYLALAGDSTVERLKIYPLIEHKGPIALELGSGSKMTVSDAWYLGLDFKSDTEFTKVAAQIDESKVKTVGSGAELMKLYPSNALPAGRYALIGDEDSRMFIVDFGAGPPVTAAAEPAK